MAIGETFKVEAEDFTVDLHFNVQSISHASGGAVLQAAGFNEQRASHIFDEVSGVYDLTLGYFDESDGASQLSILVNGVVIDSFVWDADPGDAGTTPSTFMTRPIVGIPLAPGDVVELVGFRDGGEPLRIDYLDFTHVSDGGPDVTGPVVQSASAPDLTTADAGSVTTTVTVSFADASEIDVSSLDLNDIVVTGPGGALTTTGFSVNPPGDGSPRGPRPIP